MLWLRNHPGRPVTEADVAEIFAKAYSVAANYGNAASAFAKTGINPFNPDIFTDADYLPADVTDMPKVSTVSGAAESSSTTPPTDPGVSDVAPAPAAESSSTTPPAVPDPEVATVSNAAESSSTTPPTDAGVSDVAPAPAAESSSTTPPAVPDPEVSTVSGAAESSSTMPPTDPDFSSLLPMPKHQARVSQRKRKVAHAMIATSSPFKQQLKEVQDKKMSKC